MRTDGRKRALCTTMATKELFAHRWPQKSSLRTDGRKRALCTAMATKELFAHRWPRKSSLRTPPRAPPTPPRAFRPPPPLPGRSAHPSPGRRVTPHRPGPDRPHSSSLTPRGEPDPRREGWAGVRGGLCGAGLNVFASFRRISGLLFSPIISAKVFCLKFYV